MLLDRGSHMHAEGLSMMSWPREQDQENNNQ